MIPLSDPAALSTHKVDDGLKIQVVEFTNEKENLLMAMNAEYAGDEQVQVLTT
jgi:hypothetical protein